MNEVSRVTGLNRESLYKAFDSKTQPRWATIHRLMKALEYLLRFRLTLLFKQWSQPGRKLAARV